MQGIPLFLVTKCCVALVASCCRLQIDGDANGFNPHFKPGALAIYFTVYLILMSVGAGLAIPGGLFMPSIVVRASISASGRKPLISACFAGTRGVL
jgi:H+/Cl- antiporter ClcA